MYDAANLVGASLSMPQDWCLNGYTGGTRVLTFKIPAPLLPSQACSAVVVVARTLVWMQRGPLLLHDHAMV